jgi:hypothetical protein
MAFWSRPRIDKLHYTATQRHDTRHLYYVHVRSAKRQTPAIMALFTHVRHGMLRLGLTMETYDDPARKIRFPSQKTVAGRPGSAGEENGAQLRKLRLRRKGLDPDPFVLRPCKEHQKLESGSRAGKEKRSQQGLVIGNSRRARNTGIVSKAVQQSFGGSGNLCNPRPVKMPCLHESSARAFVVFSTCLPTALLHI